VNVVILPADVASNKQGIYCTCRLAVKWQVVCERAAASWHHGWPSTHSAATTKLATDEPQMNQLDPLPEMEFATSPTTTHTHKFTSALFCNVYDD